MRIISKKALKEFCGTHPAAKAACDSWYKVVTAAQWKNFDDVRKTYPSADYVAPFVVFDVGGNNYRIIAVVSYAKQKVYLRPPLTHKEYDKGAWKQ